MEKGSIHAVVRAPAAAGPAQSAPAVYYLAPTPANQSVEVPRRPLSAPSHPSSPPRAQSAAPSRARMSARLGSVLLPALRFGVVTDPRRPFKELGCVGRPVRAGVSPPVALGEGLVLSQPSQPERVCWRGGNHVQRESWRMRRLCVPAAVLAPNPVPSALPPPSPSPWPGLLRTGPRSSRDLCGCDDSLLASAHFPPRTAR